MVEPNQQEPKPMVRTTVRLRSEQDLVAAIPHLLGFHPQHSLVVVCLAGDGPVLRIDEPRAPEEIAAAADAVVAPFREQGFGRGGVALVHFASENGHHLALNEELVTRFNGQCGLDPQVMLHVSADVVTDLVSGEATAASAASSSRLAAEFAFAGKPQPRPDRESYRRDLRAEPQRDLVLEIESIAPTLRTQCSTTAGRTAEREWISAAVADFVSDPVPMPPAIVGRLLVDLDEPDLRDVALLAITRADVHRHIALWEDLSRRAPEAHRAAPLALLAMSQWVAGDGAASWTAIEMIEASGRHHPLSDLASDLLVSATPPMKWDAVQAALTVAERHAAAEAPEALGFGAARARISQRLGEAGRDRAATEGAVEPMSSRQRSTEGPTP